MPSILRFPITMPTPPLLSSFLMEKGEAETTSFIQKFLTKEVVSGVGFTWESLVARVFAWRLGRISLPGMGLRIVSGWPRSFSKMTSCPI
jgi:hypothetical protein